MTQTITKWSPEHENFWHTLTDAMYNDSNIVSHQIDSYNEFIQTLIQEVVADSQSLKLSSDIVDLTVDFKEILVSAPQIVESDGQTTNLTPHTCRLRNLNYRAPMFLKCRLTYNIKNNNHSQILNNTLTNNIIVSEETVHVGLVPVMVGSFICTQTLQHNLKAVTGTGSTDCPSDPGGYFIINGNEKVVVNQERMACNSILITNTKKHGPQLLLRCLSNASSRTNSTCSISLDNSKRKSSTGEPSILKVSLPYLRKEITFPIIFYALGVTDVFQMIKLVLEDTRDPEMQNILVPSIEESFLSDSMTSKEKQDHALEFIGKQASSSYDQKHHRSRFASSILSKYFLPHVSVADTGFEQTKAVHFGFLINQFCQRLLGRVPYDDRDHLHNKRIESTGQLLASLFRQSFFRCVNQTRTNLEKSFASTLSSTSAIQHFKIGHFFTHSDITTTFKSALATGNWVSGRKTAVKVGVSQILNRFSYMATLSHLRRISSTMAKDGNVTKPRQLHNTHFGRICLWETPEGSACVYADTMVNVANQKVSMTISQLYKSAQKHHKHQQEYAPRLSVTGFNEPGDQIINTKCQGVVNKGLSQCVKVQLVNGQIVVCTPDHRFLCYGSEEHCYQSADQLSSIQKVLCTWEWPAVWPNTGSSGLYPSWLKTYQILSACRLAGLVAARYLCILDAWQFHYDQQNLSSTLIQDHRHQSQFHQLHLQPEELQIELASFDCLSYIIDDLELLNISAETVQQPHRQIPTICFSYEFYSFFEEMLHIELLNDPLQMLQIFNSPDHIQNFYAGFFSSKHSTISMDHLGRISVRTRASLESQEFHDLMIKHLGHLNRTFAMLFSEFTPISKENFILKSVTDNFRTYTASLSVSVKTLYQNLCFAYNPQKQMKMFIAASFQGHTELFKLFKLQPWSLICFLKTTLCLNTWQDSEINSTYWCALPVYKVEAINDEKLEVFDIINSETSNFVANTMVVHNCGFVKNFAMSAKLSTYVDSEMLKHQMVSNFSHILDINTLHQPDYFKVIVNGCILGSVCSTTVDQFIETFRHRRRVGAIHPHVSIRKILGSSAVEICSDPGRVLRPLLVVSDNKLLLTPSALDSAAQRISSQLGLWRLLNYMGLVEYIDVTEESECMVAMFPQDLKAQSLQQTDGTVTNFTHCEIHPSFMAGVCGSGIPFADTNQGPRNIYQSSMIKQSMGFFVSNFQQRFDSSAHVLWYAQKPLAQTYQMQSQLKSNELPGGQNLIVAVMAAGFNQEDSIIMNQSSVDRGLFRSDFFRTYQDEEVANDQIEEFCNPDPEQVYAVNAQMNYNNLDGDGLVNPGTQCESNAILVGKVGTMSHASKKDEPQFLLSSSSISSAQQSQLLQQRFTRKDRSQAIRPSESGVVDKVLLSSTSSGSRMCKVRMRNTRVPEMGDKFCLSGDHDVLTNQGWVPITTVTKEHKVASLAQDQSSIQYVHPINVFKFKNHPQDDQMYMIRNAKVDMCVTHEHRIYCRETNRSRFGFRKAWELERTNYWIKRTGRWNPKPISTLTPFFNIMGVDYPISHVCRLLALWFSNALFSHLQWCTKDFTNKQVFDMMVELLSNFNCKFKQCRSLSSSQVTFWLHLDCHDQQTRQIIGWLRTLGERKLPIFLFDLKPSLVKHFIHSLLWFHNQNFWNFSFSAISKTTISQLQHLAVHAGMGSVMTIQEMPSITFDENREWKVRNTTSRLRLLISRMLLQPDPQPDSIKFNYDGHVYCVEVKGGVFMTRRNGKPCWTGNSSRHGQKGTVGLLVEAADMPFSQDGLQPDIIINPHCIPSRMTIAHLIETLGSKLACHTGKMIDSTPFTQLSVDQLTSQMHAVGFQRHGNERLYSGISGKPLECEVFFGPVYYQRLKHMVADKLHCLTTDHEILTSNGWKLYYELLQTDLVASLHDGQLIYSPILDNFLYKEHKHQIVSFESDNVDLKVSQDHRLWCKSTNSFDGQADHHIPDQFHLIEASQVKSPFIKFDNTWSERRSISTISSCNSLNSHNDSSFCLGFIAYCCRRDSVKLISDTVMIDISDLRLNVEAIMHIKQKMEKTLGFIISLSHHTFKTLTMLTIYNVHPPLIRLFKQFLDGALFSSCIAWFQQIQALHFLHGFCFHKHPNLINCLADGLTLFFKAPSFLLLGEMQQLVLHAGLMQSSRHLTIYFAEHIDLTVATDNITNKSELLIPPPIESNTHLFCISVPSEIFLVKRNGKVCWTGNSRSRGPCQLFQRQPVEGRSRDGGLVNGF